MTSGKKFKKIQLYQLPQYHDYARIRRCLERQHACAHEGRSEVIGLSVSWKKRGERRRSVEETDNEGHQQYRNHAQRGGTSGVELFAGGVEQGVRFVVGHFDGLAEASVSTERVVFLHASML